MRFTRALATREGVAGWWTTNTQGLVQFNHQGWNEPVEFMRHCSTKWAIFLMSLKSLVETAKGNPSPDDVRIGNWALRSES
jgi:hypothetical protein